MIKTRLHASKTSVLNLKGTENLSISRLSTRILLEVNKDSSKTLVHIGIR